MNATVHDLLTVPEVSVELRISAPTTYRLIASGKLPASRVGKQLRVDRDDLTRFIHGETEGPA
jgi:excisionase family DNA binding protein